MINVLDSRAKQEKEFVRCVCKVSWQTFPHDKQFSPIPNNFVRIINRLNCPPTRRCEQSSRLLWDEPPTVMRHWAISKFSFGTILIEKVVDQCQGRPLEQRSGDKHLCAANMKPKTNKLSIHDIFGPPEAAKKLCASLAALFSSEEKKIDEPHHFCYDSWMDWADYEWNVQVDLDLISIRPRHEAIWRHLRSSTSARLAVDGFVLWDLWNEPSLISFLRPYHSDFAWFKRKKAIKFIAFIFEGESLKLEVYYRNFPFLFSHAGLSEAFLSS